MKHDKRDSREVGLEILHLALRHHPGSHHLHYGYWEAGLEPTIANLPKAQEAYCEFLISHIPEGTRSILDVGCGTGALARRLQDAGYEVECISPSRAFARYARELLDEGTPIHECYYEDFAPQRRYDLVLFSESFQYMKIEQALEKTMDAMDEDGRMLICDFFKTGAPGKSPMGGGHKMHRFRRALENQPLELVEDIDITEKTAPTMKIVNDMLLAVASPARDLLSDFLHKRHPFLTRFFEWSFRKKLEKAERKYFSGQKTPEIFAKYKTYRLFVFARSSAQRRRLPSV